MEEGLRLFCTDLRRTRKKKLNSGKCGCDSAWGDKGRKLFVDWCTQGFGKGVGSDIWVVVNKQVSFKKFNSGVLQTFHTAYVAIFNTVTC